MAVSATADARRDGWAAEATLGLAGEWAASGARVFLLDLGLEEPELHELLDGVRGEGIADAILFGGSIRRVAREVDDAGFFFASAGSPVADPAEVYGAPRWSALIDGFLGAGVTVILYVPSEAEGADALLARATHSVLMASPDEDAKVLLAPVGGRNLAILGPGWGTVFSPVEPAADPDLGVNLAGVPDDQVEWLGGDDEALRTPNAPRPIEMLPKDGPPAATGHRRLIWAGLVAVAAVVGGFTLWGGGGPGDGPSAAEAVSPVQEPVVPPPSPVGGVQAFSIAMGSYRDASAALSRAAGLASAVTGAMFVTSPVEVDGEIWWRVLAGPAPDSAGAEALRAVLALEIGGPASSVGDNWLVRRTQLAFLLGEEETLEQARSLADAFRDSGAPAYVLEVPYSDNTTRFRIYAGAFATPEESEVLWNGLEGILTERPALTDRLGHQPA